MPYLNNNSKNINEARRILRVAANGLQEAFTKECERYQNELSKRFLLSLDLTKSALNLTDHKTERGFLKLLEDEPISTVESLIGGCSQLIEGNILTELQARKLESLIKNEL